MMNLKQAIKNKKVGLLTYFLFGVKLSKGQEQIVKYISYCIYKRISISAMTRYGKTYCVAIAVCLYILFNNNKKVALIAPQAEQAQVLRNYISELIISNEILRDLTDFDTKGYDALKKEVSKRRVTFKNGCEYRVFSAHGDANRLMGFGADLIIKDEACLIPDEANAKIMRMAGDNPEEAVIIEIYNPWDRDNKAFEHTLNPNWKKIQIDWKQAVKEKRTTKEYIEEQRKEMTHLEFTVLYDSKFPREAEDSLHSLDDIKKAENIVFDFKKEIEKLKNTISNKKKVKEQEYLNAKKELKRYKRIISCDPADKGKDYTVIFIGYLKDNKYFEVIDIYFEQKSTPMKIVGKVIKIAEQDKITKTEIKIDEIGIGRGTQSRLKEVKNEKDLKNIKILGCHYGEKAINSKEFRNKKAENNFYLKKIMLDNNLSLNAIKDKKGYNKLIRELVSMKWEITSSVKKRVLDPENKSPDFNDSLVYFVWKDNKSLAYAFI